MNGTDKVTKQAALAVVMAIIYRDLQGRGVEPEMKGVQDTAVDLVGSMYKVLDKDDRSLTEMLSDL